MDRRRRVPRPVLRVRGPRDAPARRVRRRRDASAGGMGGDSGRRGGRGGVLPRGRRPGPGSPGRGRRRTQGRARSRGRLEWSGPGGSGRGPGRGRSGRRRGGRRRGPGGRQGRRPVPGASSAPANPDPAGGRPLDHRLRPGATGAARVGAGWRSARIHRRPGPGDRRRPRRGRSGVSAGLLRRRRAPGRRGDLGRGRPAERSRKWPSTSAPCGCCRRFRASTPAAPASFWPRSDRTWAPSASRGISPPGPGWPRATTSAPASAAPGGRDRATGRCGPRSPNAPTAPCTPGTRSSTALLRSGSTRRARRTVLACPSV